MARSSLRKHLNPWLIVVGVVAVILFASLAGLNPYISTKAKPVPNKVKPGDNYPVNYVTSATIPSVRIDLCSDSTNTPCIPMIPNATGTQTLIVIPGTFPTGQAHINVTNRDASGQLTSTIQRTSFVTIVAPDSNSTASSTATGSSNVFSSLFNNGSSTSNSTSSSTSGGGSTQTTTTNQSCPVTSCPGFPSRLQQVQDCGGVQKVVTMNCAFISSENQCDWQYPACPAGGFNSPPPTTPPATTGNQGGSSVIPTPIPEQVQFYSVLIYYRFAINGQSHIVADVVWQQPAGTRAVIKPDAGNIWTESISASTGHARFDLTGAGIQLNQDFWLEAQDSGNQPVGTPLHLNVGSPPNSTFQQYIYGGTSNNSTPATPLPNQQCSPSECPPLPKNSTMATSCQNSFASVYSCQRQNGQCLWTYQYSCDSNNSLPNPTPTPDFNAIKFSGLVIQYGPYSQNNPSIKAYVTWSGGPDNAMLAYRADNGGSWKLATRNKDGTSSIDLAASFIGYEANFWIEAQDIAHHQLSYAYRYTTGINQTSSQTTQVIPVINGDPGYPNPLP